MAHMIIAKHVLQVHFYVMPIGTMEEHVILGHTWCYLTNCQIDWHKKQAKMVYKGNATQVSLLHEDTSTPHPQKPLNLQTLHLQPPQHSLINHNLANNLRLVHTT